MDNMSEIVGFHPSVTRLVVASSASGVTLVAEPRSLSQEKTTKTRRPTANSKVVTVLEALLTKKLVIWWQRKMGSQGR